jgi:hypothetical protein
MFSVISTGFAWILYYFACYTKRVYLLEVLHNNELYYLHFRSLHGCNVVI